MPGLNFSDLNDKFALISVGNQVVVMELDEVGNIIELWPRPEFKALLMKEKVKVEKVDAKGQKSETVVSLPEYWLQHKDGRRYERLVYDMPGGSRKAKEIDYNGWLGYKVKPEAGSWKKNKEHLLNIICAEDEGLYNWLFNWLASLIQFPGKHGMVALVLHGGPGIGKGHMAAKMLGALFHKQQFIHLIGADQLTGRFNDHLSGKVLVFADEATWGGDVRAAEKLKGLITESIINIERKFISAIEEPSALHIIIASNNDWPVSIDPRDRRYTIFNVADTKQQNDKYFGLLLKELDEGGHAALLYDLLQHEVDQPMTRQPYWTRSKGEIAIMSLKPIERWWFEKLQTGALVNKQWPTTVVKNELHNDYIEFSERHDIRGRSLRATQTELGMHLSKMGARSKNQIQVSFGNNGHKPEYAQIWTFPDLLNSRKLWLTRMGWDPSYQWSEDV